MITSLPTLKARIFRSFLVIIAIYAFLGVVLVIGVFFASGTTPKLLHMNYDSTAAADRMRRAWDALGNLKQHTEHDAKGWESEFDAGLAFEQGNITEAGERDAVRDLTAIWQKAKKSPSSISSVDFLKVHAYLDEVVRVNENAMFRLAQWNAHLSQGVLFGAISYFILTLILASIFARGIADRLAEPLKQISEILRGKPKLGKELKLPLPSSLEVLILNHELKRMWKRLNESNQVNVTELLQQKKKLETVLVSIEDALIVINSEGVVEQCNEYFARLVGLDSKRIIGNVWRDLASMNDNYMKLREELHNDMAENCEFDLFLADRKLSYAARWRPIEPVKGNITGVVYMLHDVTEKRQRDQLRAEIIDLLSHELKTPLQSLGTASELLSKQRADFPEDLKLLIDTVSEDVDRIKAVAHEFVQVTQTHSKIMKLKLEPVALSQVLPEWLKPFSVVARDKKIKLEFSQVGSPVIWANVDSVKFPWVISNLLSNALRFSPPDETVKIVLSDEKGVIEIRVEDNGPGIPAEDQARIFEPFFQSTMQSVDGSRGLFGVGLTIAREVVEAHEGTIEYNPREPRGSCFRIVLPVPG